MLVLVYILLLILLISKYIILIIKPFINYFNHQLIISCINARQTYPNRSIMDFIEFNAFVLLHLSVNIRQIYLN